jgi:hypothetical protein
MVRTVLVVLSLFVLSAFAVGENKGNCPSPPPISAKKNPAPTNPTEITVSVLVVISDTGYVCSAQVLQGVDKVTDAEAVRTVRAWQFSLS